jgi:hypothetical protein
MTYLDAFWRLALANYARAAAMTAAAKKKGGRAGS